MVWPDDVYSIVLAVVLGAALGLEREIRGKAAGLRTNILICIGAALFTIVSERMALAHDASVTRIAAQIVTGVGFLGAGAIIQDRAGIHGLTTAATIWIVASIGMACGGGLHLLAIITAGVAVILLTGLGKLVKSTARHSSKQETQERADDTGEQS